jgi:hypothetical protein
VAKKSKANPPPPALSEFPPPNIAVDLAALRQEVSAGFPPDAAKVSDVLPEQSDPRWKHITPAELADLLQRERSSGLMAAEKIAILEMTVAGLSPQVIATRLERSVAAVRKFQDRYRSRVPLARAFLESRADVFAKRVLEQADVDQSMEVLDRLDVLPKHERGSGNTNAQFNIIVGGGTAPGSIIPAPDQKLIEASKEP